MSAITNLNTVAYGVIQAQNAIIDELNVGSIAPLDGASYIEITGDIHSHGAFIGEVTGNLVGNVIGNVIGNMVGNVQGNVEGTANYALTSGTSVNFAGSLLGDITGTQITTTIKNGVITSDKLSNGSITTAKIANGAITSEKLSPNIILPVHIADGSITTVKIANEAITSDKIVNEAITSDKLSNGSITTAKIANNAIINEKILDNTISGAKLQTITTAGKVANSATSASSNNTPNTIILRDASGNFNANNVQLRSLIMRANGELLGALQVLANNNSTISVGIGRISYELEIGVAAQNGHLSVNSLAGDAIIRNNNISNSIIFASGTNGVVKINSDGLTSTIISTNMGTSSGGSNHWKLKSNSGSQRWGFGMYQDESGTDNTGSNFALWRYADDSSFIGSAFTINRSTGQTSISSLTSNSIARLNGGIDINNQNITGCNSLFTNGLQFRDNSAVISGPGKIAFTNQGEIDFYHSDITTARSVSIDASVWGSSGVLPSPLQLRNSSNTTRITMQIGRTSNELEMGVVANAGELATGSISGEAVLKSLSSNVIIAAGNSPTLKVMSNRVISRGVITNAGWTVNGSFTYLLYPGSRNSLISSYGQRGTGNMNHQVFSLTATGGANGCSVNGVISITNNPTTTSVVTNNTINFTMSYAQGNVNITQSTVSSQTPGATVTLGTNLSWDTTNNRLMLAINPSTGTTSAVNCVWDAAFDVIVNQNFNSYAGFSGSTPTVFTITVSNYAY